MCVSDCPLCVYVCACVHLVNKALKAFLSVESASRTLPNQNLMQSAQPGNPKQFILLLGLLGFVSFRV